MKARLDNIYFRINFAKKIKKTTFTAMNNNIVSIIIINYNTAKLTADCVQSIFEYEKVVNFEIIIVDNSSEYDDYKELCLLLANYSQVKIIRSKINLGFGGGNMLGFQHSTAPFLVFVNSDVLWVEPVLEELIQFANITPSFGVGGPQVLNKDYEKSISYRYFEGLRYKLFGRRFLELTKKDKLSKKIHLKTPFTVDFIIGSFMFFKTNVFESIGGFDTNIFLYYDETDVSQRLLKSGYKTYFFPQKKYIHLEGQSSPVNMLLKVEHWLSYFYVTRKNSNLVKYLIIKYYILLTYFLKAPFKKKNRYIFKKMLKMQECMALSMKHNQKAKSI